MFSWSSGQTPDCRQGVVLIVSVHFGSNHTVTLLMRQGIDRHLWRIRTFCYFLQRFTPKMHKTALSLTGSSLHTSNDLISAPTSWWYVTSNRCFEIRSISEDQWQMTLLSLQIISINLPPFHQQHILFPYCSFLHDTSAFSTAESCSSHLLCLSCCECN